MNSKCEIPDVTEMRQMVLRIQIATIRAYIRQRKREIAEMEALLERFPDASTN